MGTARDRQTDRDRQRETETDTERISRRTLNVLPNALCWFPQDRRTETERFLANERESKPWLRTDREQALAKNRQAIKLMQSGEKRDDVSELENFPVHIIPFTVNLSTRTFPTVTLPSVGRGSKVGLSRQHAF